MLYLFRIYLEYVFSEFYFESVLQELERQQHERAEQEAAQHSMRRQESVSDNPNLDDLVSVLTTGDFTDALSSRRRERGMVLQTRSQFLSLQEQVVVEVYLQNKSSYADKNKTFFF